MSRRKPGRVVPTEPTLVCEYGFRILALTRSMLPQLQSDQPCATGNWKTASNRRIERSDMNASDISAFTRVFRRAMRGDDK
jgi:hypothetical protein